jgi:hypothetical protein
MCLRILLSKIISIDLKPYSPSLYVYWRTVLGYLFAAYRSELWPLDCRLCSLPMNLCMCFVFINYVPILLSTVWKRRFVIYVYVMDFTLHILNLLKDY